MRTVLCLLGILVISSLRSSVRELNFEFCLFIFSIYFYLNFHFNFHSQIWLGDDSKKKIKEKLFLKRWVGEGLEYMFAARDMIKGNILRRLDGRKKRTSSENEIQNQLLAEYTRGIPDYEYTVETSLLSVDIAAGCQSRLSSSIKPNQTFFNTRIIYMLYIQKKMCNI